MNKILQSSLLPIFFNTHHTLKTFCNYYAFVDISIVTKQNSNKINHFRPHQN